MLGALLVVEVRLGEERLNNVVNNIEAPKTILILP